ncbi:MAG: hypothetical protein K0S23_1248 [Fluviicola sp.]|jgi:hypothetical protein|uniref:hypothetical protein n=1 Tax=Fluviicola sp. TaxID=1917219 RepID=UPI0026357CAD|nr:hypothetical protein [Fluviicola sp.]MDF3026941.1 hypothetical protein [Fluviicola sp.]
MLKNKGLLTRIRSSRGFKGLCTLLMLSIFFEIVQPTVSLALTEGPSQPEVQSFEPIGTTDMVDVFSGDFNYNIPLFNLPGPNGGYPINLAYHAGASVDDEASWVGLGWNINPGSLVRNMRGLPDEFKSTESGDNAAATGDYLEVKSDMKQNMTVGSSFNTKLELVGADFTASSSYSTSIYYNNYRGLGISMDKSISAGIGDVQGGTGLSLDSDNGVGVSTQLGFKDNYKRNQMDHEFKLTFDGKLSMDYSLTRTKKPSALVRLVAATFGITLKNKQSHAGSSMTFARSAFSPSLAFKMNKWNASFGLYGGVQTTYVYAGYGGSVFFNTEDMNDENKSGRKHLVLGYDNFGNTSAGSGEKYSKDFSRERDGQITATAPYLPVSNYTYDTYASSGQGLSGYFRPHRNDVGRVHDPKLRNDIYGGSLNVEVGAGGVAEAGIQINLNYGYTSQGAWDENNELNNEFGASHPSSSTTTTLDENVYYKAHGEPAILENSDIDYQFDLSLPKLKFAPKGTSGSGTTMYGGKRHMKDADFPTFSTGKKTIGKPRSKRNTTISNLKNSDVTNLGEYQVKHYNWSSLDLTQQPSVSFNRSTRNGVNIGSHYAGFKVLNEEGAHYVYALPAYNNAEVENLFSTEGGIQNGTYLTNIDLKNNEVDYKQYAKGHQYIKKVKKSPFAHSYLLTSVQGADYVDITNNGPSNDDLGYWVKFSYVNKATNYKWRAPYDRSKAFFSQGASYTDEDDKASYSYGEKELWYMGRMETKTHVAIFKMSEREDMVEASAEIGTTTDTDLSDQQVPLKLDAIVIYDKKSFEDLGENARFLQKIVFDYEYKLCRGIPNSKNTINSHGKLMLTKLSFMSNGSTRGLNNSYSFQYQAAADGPAGTTYANPYFQTGAYDSWGMYKPRIDHEFANNFPYVNQFNQHWDDLITWKPPYTHSVEDQATREITKSTQDGLASAWSLSKIILPSKGEINVKYEADDYGYVQHKTANQMFKIASLGNTNNPGRIYEDKQENFETDPEKKRVYFKLEKPIPTSNTLDECAAIVFNDYVKPIHQENGERYLYFKTKMKLTSGVHDYVSGYLPMENGPKVLDVRTYGVAEVDLENNSHIASVDGISCYTYGYVTVKSTSKIRKPSQKYTYHPMAIAGWTYLQTSATELFQDQAGFSDDVNESNFMGKIGAFMNILPEMLINWGGVKNYCAGKKFCSDINLNLSCIRLASPDKIKFGGGHRVKEISITDDWGTSTGGGTADNRTYGQRYEYTIEENGKLISSGVAAYEPQAGGDENALKYPYFYAEKQNYFSKNNLFTEAPFNEALFPGANVGYRKVTVSSINTDNQIKNAAPGGAPPVGRTGGITEHYFYTAKEFPTMVEASQLKEENSTLDSYNLLIPIPLIGSLKYNYYHGTQAFKIELNDMHGKPKGIKTYEINNYVKNISPITETSYEYQCDPISYMGEQVWKLNNEVSVIPNDNSHTPSSTKLLGVEVDLFTDQRESKSFHVSAGAAFNLDVAPLPFPLPSVWPSYSNTKQLFRTYVTNKVIHRAGILKKTISRDLQSSNESEIMAYDEISGNPILVKTKNEFGDDFYSYSIPAYYQYDLMGHASRNIDYCFKTTLNLASGNCYYTFNATTPVDRTNELVRGDELLVNGVKCYFLGWTYNGDLKASGMIHAPFGSIPGSLTDASLRVIRSGRRNHYATMAGNYLTKGSIENNGLSNISLTLGDGTAYTAKKINANVLSATASLFMDSWRDEIPGTYQTLDFPMKDRLGNTMLDERGNPIIMYGETFIGDDQVNPYLTGNAGIWRSYKSYTYVGKRKSSALLSYNATDTDPKLYDDGVFDEAVPMFDWNLGLPEDYTNGVGGPYTYKDWEWTNEITRFNTEAYETENVNRLGIYSSALYGYDNSLSIGVGGNASLHELGVMDFETFSTASVPFGQSLRENGLNFYNNTVNAPKKLLVTEIVNFSNALYTANNDVVEITFKFKTPDEATAFAALVDASNYNMGNNTPTLETYQNKSSKLENTFGITLVSKASANKKGNQSLSLNGRLQGSVAVGSYEVKCTFKPYVCKPGDADKFLPNNSYYYGKITMLKKRSVANVESSVVATTTFPASGTDGMKAHSGKKMMKVNGSLMFEQQKFCFEKNKTYVLSMWVSRTNQDVKTYQTSNLVQPIMINQSTLAWVLPPAPSATTTVKYTYGKIIEGWQKVDIEFNIGNDGVFDNNIFAIRFNTGSTPLYVDDVRLSPKTGGMKTFVYDPITFWLKATLNVDNYATFYHYNEQGALTLTKQETEKGIFSVSESRSRLKK